MCFYYQQPTYFTYKNIPNLEKRLQYNPPVRMSVFLEQKTGLSPKDIDECDNLKKDCS